MSVIDGMTEARLNGYGWDEINGHLADATDTALAAGYTPEEVDAHLGYKDPSILHSQLADITPETPPTATPDSEPAPLAPSVMQSYAKAMQEGSATGPANFADILGSAWGLDQDTVDQIQGQLPTHEDAIDHGIAVAHMNGDDPFSGAITASQNMFDLWAQTGMTPQEVVASRDPLLIDALTKEQPADHPTIEEAAQIKMPTLAELQDQVGRDAIQKTFNPALMAAGPVGVAASFLDPEIFVSFLKDLYKLPAAAADYRDETEKMRAEGKDVSERWKDDPGINFAADTLVTGGVLKGAHVAAGVGTYGVLRTASLAKAVAEHPLMQDLLHDESGSVNIGKIAELAGEKVKEAPKEPPAEGETPRSTLTADEQLSPEQVAELQKAQVKPAIDAMVSNLGKAKVDPVPELPLPEGIEKTPQDISSWVVDLDHEIKLLRGNAAADAAESYKSLAAEPDEWLHPDFLKKVEQEVEQRLGNPGAEVSPEVQEFLDAHKSLTDKQHALAREEAKLMGRDPSGLRTVDEGHVHRVVQGQENLGSVLDPETRRDPITGMVPRTLTKYDPGMKSRADMYVFEDEAGNRNWGSRPLEETGHAMGDTVEDPTGRYTIKPARMDEIEANTDIRYNHNFLGNLHEDVLQRSRVVRNLRLLQKITPALEEQGLYSAEPRSGMEKVDLPQMPGYMEPRIANVLNDFYQMAHEKGDLNHYMSSATAIIMKSLYISPFTHLKNEITHFIPARGEDWITPRGIGRSYRLSGEAMRDALSFSDEYIEYLRHGGTPLYLNAKLGNYIQFMRTKFFHEQMADAGGLWSQMAKWTGFGTVKNMVQAEYNWSQRTLWAGSDQMRMFLYREAKEKGMTPAEAVADVNRNMPSYQIPTEVLMAGPVGHAMSELLKNPYLFVFGRYRYGQVATLANHIRDFVGPGQTLAERRQALAKLLITGGQTYAMSLMHQYGGPGSLIHAAAGLATGEKDWQQANGSVLTFGPLFDLYKWLHDNQNHWGKEVWRTGGTTLGNIKQEVAAAIGTFPAGQDLLTMLDPKKGGWQKVLLKLLGWDMAKEPVDPAKKAAWEKRQAAQALAAERKDDVETWVRNMLGDPLPAPAGRSGGGGGGHSGGGGGGGGHSGGGIVMRGSGSQRSAPGLDSGGVVLRGQGYAPRQTGPQAGFPAGGNGIVAGENPAPQPASSRTSSTRGGGRSRRFYYARRRR